MGSNRCSFYQYTRDIPVCSYHLLKVLRYNVVYQVVDCHSDRPEGCDEMQIFNISTIDANPAIDINDLRKYTNYSFQVQVVNSVGAGNYSPPFYLMTDQDSKYATFDSCV